MVCVMTITCVHTPHAREYREAVKKGNKLFGAAILKLSDLSLVVVGTNTEIECPLWHGEVRTGGENFADPPPTLCLQFALFSLLVPRLLNSLNSLWHTWMLVTNG